MSDDSTTFSEIKDEVLRFAEERDWLKFHNPKNLSMALSAEGAELLEHFLWCEGSESKQILDDKDRKSEVADELADILIYAIEFANAADIDISDAIRAKMIKNGIKYPVDKSKGNSLKYTKL